MFEDIKVFYYCVMRILNVDLIIGFDKFVEVNMCYINCMKFIFYCVYFLEKVVFVIYYIKKVLIIGVVYLSVSYILYGGCE